MTVARVDSVAMLRSLISATKQRLGRLHMDGPLRIGSIEIAGSYDGYGEGIDNASVAWGRRPRKHARHLVERELGGVWDTRTLDPDCTINEVLASVAALNADPRIHGIIIARPSPERFSRKLLQQAVDPVKDVEGMHPESIGKLVYGTGNGKICGDSLLYPCTAKAAVLVLKQAYEELGRSSNLNGVEALVVGDSDILAKPVVSILHDEGATVTVCSPNSAPNFAVHTRAADVVFSAAGSSAQRGLLRGNMFKPGAVLIDLGFHVSPDGNFLGGDADLASCDTSGTLAKFASLCTGVGIVRSAVLCANLVCAAEMQQNLKV